MAKIVRAEGILDQSRREIAQRGEAILVAERGDEAYVVQAAGGCFEPEDDEELATVLDAARETSEPLRTPAKAREQLQRLRAKP